MSFSFSIYEIGDHQIYQGDAISVLQEVVPDGSIDLVFADPPYNIGKNYHGWKDQLAPQQYLEWCYQWLNLCIQKLSPTGSLYLMTATQFMPYFDLFLRDRLSILSRIVWTYDSSGVQARQKFGSLYEPILHCVRNPRQYTFNGEDILVEAKTGARRKLIDYRKSPPTVYNSTKVPGNTWYFPRVRYKMAEYEDHPSQKPEALLERIIRASSHPGDLVLDPFAGTFTTARVAQTLGRRSISIELQEAYVAVGLKRLDK